jgi:hypothetical protein
MNTTTPAFSLDHLSDDDLLTNTRAQVGRSNRVLAGLLAHLAEVDARGLYRLCACSSLSSYCIYELRMSEDVAQRRGKAAKIARRFPVLFEQIAAGQIHVKICREECALALGECDRIGQIIDGLGPLASVR